MEKPKTSKAKKCNYMQHGPEDVNGRSRLPKEEKKARQILSQLKMIPMHGFKRIVMRCTDSTEITIENPEVYRPPNSDTYIVFGVPRCSEPGEHAQEAAAQTFKIQDLLQQAMQSEESTTEESNEDNSCESHTALRVSDNDIDILMSQCKVSRKKAIKTLLQHDNDLVNAIMYLTV